MAFNYCRHFLGTCFKQLSRPFTSCGLKRSSENTAIADDEHLADIATPPLVNNASVYSHIEQGLRKCPHKAAVVCMHQPANHLSELLPVDDVFRQQNGADRNDCLTLTYTQLHRVAMTLAAGIMANGVQPGSTILTLIPNAVEYSILFWTCMVMRLTFTSLDPLTLKESGNADLRNFLSTLNPSIVVVQDAAGAKAVEDAVRELGIRKPLQILLSGDTSNGWKSLLDLAGDALKSPVDENPLLQAARNDDPDRILSVLFTSGTSTGRPRGCPLRVGSMTHILLSQSWLINEDNCDLVLQQGHNSHTIALHLTLLTWRMGGAVVLPTSNFAIEHTLDAIVQHGATFVVLGPAMVHALAHEVKSRPGNLDSVRTIQVGGAACTKDVLLKCAAMFPKAKIYVNHGMTEGGGLFTWPFSDTPVPRIPYFGEICPTGAVAPGANVRILNPDTKSVNKRGEPGELHVSCESVIREYLNGEAASSFYEDKKGRWFNTGDIAMLDDKGLVFIFGRSKDMIKRAGVPVMPAALESCIENYVSAQTSVVSIPHPSVGHEPFAVLAHFNGKDEVEIKNHILHALGNDYALRGLASLKQLGLEEFPVNASHKIVKFEVQQAVIDYLNRTIA